jgi:hypothetical protein
MQFRIIQSFQRTLTWYVIGLQSYCYTVSCDCYLIEQLEDPFLVLSF